MRYLPARWSASDEFGEIPSSHYSNPPGTLEKSRRKKIPGV